MHLKRKVLLRVEQLRQDRKARRVGNVAEDRLPMFAPKIVQGLAAQRPLVHYALGFRPVDNFPRLTDQRRRRQTLAVERFQSPSAPNPLHEEWLENEGLSELRFCHEL
jgi:hypothetical protein